MTDNEKRAHDFAIAMLPIAYYETDESKKETFNGYANYDLFYHGALKLFNADYPENS